MRIVSRKLDRLRKWNVVIHDIVGDLRERLSVTEEKVRSFMSDTLKREVETVKTLSFAYTDSQGSDEAKRRIILCLISFENL